MIDIRTKKQINIEIGEQIKCARESIRFTQEQLAELVEVSPQYISDLERGVVGISISTLKRVCIALNVSSDRILFGTADRLPQDLSDKLHFLSEEQHRFLREINSRMVDLILTERFRRTWND